MEENDKRDLMQEASILQSLNHPNIVHFKELIVDNKNDYIHIVMEYADGGDLSQKIKSQKGKLFTESQILHWFYQICQAIRYLHENKKIIHRDIKSSNIFLTKNNQIKLGDFGIAKRLNKTFSKAHTIVGTPYYLSPEIINNEPYDYKSDIWAMGVLLYEMVTLKLPFDSNNIAQLYIKIVKGVYQPISCVFSKELRMLITSMLKVKSKLRPSIGDIMNFSIMKEMNKKKRRNSELSRAKNESANNIFIKFANCSVRKGIEADSKKKEDKTVNKKNNCAQVKVNKGKNSILEEFMKNKQEKIRHSKIISQSIGESIWFKNYSLFTNNKEKNENKENNNINTFEIVNNEPVSNPDNKINDKFIDELDILSSFKFDSSENSIEEEKDKTNNSNEKVIHLDNLSIISNSELRCENETEFEIEKNSEIEEKEEVIPIDLDIPKDTKTFSESEVESSIKRDIVNQLGENFLSELMNFIKKNITPDLEDYSYDRLINQLKNKFSSAYPKSKIDNAIQYIPDIQFLIISSQKM